MGPGPSSNHIHNPFTHSNPDFNAQAGKSVILEDLRSVPHPRAHTLQEIADIRERHLSLHAEVQKGLLNIVDRLHAVTGGELVVTNPFEEGEELFTELDFDSTGRISRWEFIQAWIKLGLQGTEQAMQRVFDSYATDGGDLSKASFISVLKDQQSDSSRISGLLKQIDDAIAALDAKFRKGVRRRKREKAAQEEKSNQSVKMLIALMKPDDGPDTSSQALEYERSKKVFMKFDRDENCELGLSEYGEAVRELGKPKVCYFQQRSYFL